MEATRTIATTVNDAGATVQHGLVRATSRDPISTRELTKLIPPPMPGYHRVEVGWTRSMDGCRVEITWIDEESDPFTEPHMVGA